MHRTRRAAAALALLALAALLTAAPHLHPTAASAATTGAGIPGLTPYGNYLGNYIAPDGARVYCIDSSLAWPAGTTAGAELVDTVQATWGEGLPEDSLLKLNYVLLAYGQTDDPVQAAAVAAFVYAYTSGWARDLGPGYAAGAFYVNGNTDVTKVYDAIWAEAEANAVPTATATAEIEMIDATSGVVILSASAPQAVGTLHLTGAVVSETGEQAARVSASTEVAIRGLPADDARDYSIAATVTYSLTTPAAANLVLYATGDQQRTVRGGTPGSLSFQASTETERMPVDFSPVVTTAVSTKSVEPGESFVDLVTAAVSPGSRPWRVRTDGSYARVLARGVLYGPLDEAPATSPTVPADAPVAGRQSLVLAGPGTYSTSDELVASSPGFYTWVWTIDYDDQASSDRASLPEGYSWASAFGLPEETHVVPVTPPAGLPQTGSSPVGTGVIATSMLAAGALGISARRRRYVQGE